MTEDVLIVSYDKTNGDAVALTVGRYRGDDVLEIINVFFGEQAEEIYKKLTGDNND